MPPSKCGTKAAGKHDAGKNNAGKHNAGNKNTESRVFVFFDPSGQPWVLRESKNGMPTLTRILDIKDASEHERAVLSVMNRHPNNTAERHVADEVVAVLKDLIEDWCAGLRELRPEVLLAQNPWSQAEINDVARVSNASMTSVVDMRSGNKGAKRAVLAILGLPEIVLAQTCQASRSNDEKPAPLMIVVTVPASENPKIARTSIGLGVASVHCKPQGVALLPPVMFTSVPLDSTGVGQNSHAVGTVAAGNTLWAIILDLIRSNRRMNAHGRLREAGFELLVDPVAFEVCSDNTGVAVVGQQRPFKGAPGDIVLVPSESDKRALEKATHGARTVVRKVLRIKTERKFKPRVRQVGELLEKLKTVSTTNEANEVLATIANISEQYGHANNLYAFNAMLLWLAWCTSNQTISQLRKLDVKAHKVSSNALLAAICLTLRLPLQTGLWILARTKQCCVTLSADGQRMLVTEKSNRRCERVLAALLQQAMRNAGNQGTSDAWALLMNLLVIVLNNESTQLGQGAWPQVQEIQRELRKERDPFATPDFADLPFRDTKEGGDAKRAYELARGGQVP